MVGRRFHTQEEALADTLHTRGTATRKIEESKWCHALTAGVEEVRKLTMYGPKMDRFWAETDSFPQWYGRSLQICRAKLGSLFNQVRQVLYGAHFGKCLISIYIDSRRRRENFSPLHKTLKTVISIYIDFRDFKNYWIFISIYKYIYTNKPL